MNLQATIEVYAGGPGSGCNPEKGHCGRIASKEEKQVYSYLKELNKKKDEEGFSHQGVVPLEKLKETPGDTYTVPVWVHGWLNKDGNAVGQDIIHSVVLKQAGIKGSPEDFMRRTGWIRASTGNHFEYPLVEIHAKPTEEQRASIGKMWQFVKNNPNWSKYEFSYELHPLDRGKSVTDGTFGGRSGKTFGDFLRDVDKVYGA